MFNSQKNQRPNLIERHSQFLDLYKLREMIELLEVAYHETRNEKVHRVLQTFKGVFSQGMEIEEIYRQQEIIEFWNNPGAWPDAVRIWYMHYRDNDLDV